MSQNHGFVFENEVIKSITGFTKDEYQSLINGKYTASMDIEKGVHSNVNVSCKTSKNGIGVGCGDIVRFMKHCNETSFTLLIGCWYQKNYTTKVFNTVYEFYINPQNYNVLWKNIEFATVEKFVAYVKNIPEGKIAQLANKKLWKEHRQNIYDQYGKGIMNIDAKIDSKNQRRVQCSVKIKDLIESGIPYCKYENDFKGISIPHEQKSEPRTFTKS